MAIEEMADSWLFIPGQHDMPGHNPKKIPSSSFGVLNVAISDNPENSSFFNCDSLHFHDFGYVEDLNTVQQDIQESYVNVAIIHTLVYDNKPFLNAPAAGNIINVAKKFKDYDVVICGDNHEPCHLKVDDGPLIINCGSMMRINAKQKDYKPAMHVVYKDLKTDEYDFISIPFDISDDVFSTEHLEIQKAKDERINQFADSLCKSDEFTLDFRLNLLKYIDMNKIEEDIKQIILEKIGN